MIGGKIEDLRQRVEEQGALSQAGLRLVLDRLEAAERVAEAVTSLMLYEQMRLNGSVQTAVALAGFEISIAKARYEMVLAAENWNRVCGR